MPNVYLRKDLYDRIAERGQDPRAFVNELVEKVLREEERRSEKE